jgi:polar amino acid transport system permease protein
MNLFSYPWNFGSVLSFLPLLLRGLGITLLLTMTSIAIGTPLGVLSGIALLIPSRGVRIPLQLITDAVRSLPPLVLLLWVYYFVPFVIGVPDLGAFWLATIAFSINLAAFVADVVRSSLLAFPPNLVDAAVACGLSPGKTLQKIVLPDVFREIFPTLSVLYIGVLKMTSLASIITVHEIVHAADQIRLETFQVIEVYTILGLLYLAVVIPLSAAARWLERSQSFRRR